MVQPGPGGVLLFAEQVESRWRETERTKGVRSALGWVLGKSNEHPVTSRLAKGPIKPPTMREIKRACGEARTAGENTSKTRTQAPRAESPPRADYYKGVRECLQWISVGGSPPRRP